MAAISICSDFGAQENKVFHCFHCFPIYLPCGDGTTYHDLSFWMLSFKLAFSLSSFSFIKKLFSSFSLSALRWCHLHIWGYCISPGNLDSSLCFTQPCISHDVLSFLNLMWISVSFSRLRKFIAIISSNSFSVPFLSLLFMRSCNTNILLDVSYKLNKQDDNILLSFNLHILQVISPPPLLYTYFY